MAQSIIAMLLFVGIGALIAYSIPFILAAGIAYVIFRGTIWIFRTLKGEIDALDHATGVAAGTFPFVWFLYGFGLIPGWSVFVPLAIPAVRILYHFIAFESERSADTMQDQPAADDIPPPGDAAAASHETPPHDTPTDGDAFPPPPRDLGGPPGTTTLPGSPLADLYKELGDIVASGDRSLLTQRLAALKRSMDATTFEKNIGAWLRKFNATVEVVESMNRAERTRMDHDFMPLERQKREAELMADIEHHKAREAEARMRQRMAHEE